MKAGSQSRQPKQPEQLSSQSSRASVQAEQAAGAAGAAGAETTGGRPPQLKIWGRVSKLHSLERKHLVR